MAELRLDRDAIALELARIAREAGDLLLGLQGDSGAVITRADGTPVCSADREADRLLQDRLSRMFPGIPIVSEENEASHRVPLGQHPFFLVDPLDGTRAYLAGGRDYCVLIALVKAGAPIVAALDAPALGESYRVGEALFRSRDRQQLAGERIDPVDRSDNQIIAIISANHSGEASRLQSGKLGATSVRFENSALKFARLATGEADIYPRAGRTMQWDVAAGDAMLRAIGGGVLDTDGKPLIYGSGALGWANPSFVAHRRLP